MNFLQTWLIRKNKEGRTSLSYRTSMGQVRHHRLVNIDENGQITAAQLQEIEDLKLKGKIKDKYDPNNS